MNQLPFYEDIHLFAEALKALHKERSVNNKKSKRLTLSKKQRENILKKTDYRCHVCGILLTDKFEADHVKSHSSGGAHLEENYLPACRLCNNYRWFYSPEEIQWILKIGVWAKTHIETQTKTGKAIAKEFLAYEYKREKRNKNSRIINLAMEKEVTQAKAIIEAFKVLKGTRSISEIEQWVENKYKYGWKDYSTCMADMVPLMEGGNKTTNKKNEDQLLRRDLKGKYYLINNK